MDDRGSARRGAGSEGEEGEIVVPAWIALLLDDEVTTNHEFSIADRAGTGGSGSE
jgi:hypothetical protein